MVLQAAEKFPDEGHGFNRSAPGQADEGFNFEVRPFLKGRGFSVRVRTSFPTQSRWVAHSSLFFWLEWATHQTQRFVPATKSKGAPPRSACGKSLFHEGHGFTGCGKTLSSEGDGL
jgi:hypothetical protein